MTLKQLLLWMRREDEGNHASRCDETDDGTIRDAWQRLQEPDGKRAYAACGILFTDEERAAMLARLRAALPLPRRLCLASSEADRLAFVEGATSDEIRLAIAELGPHKVCLESALAEVKRRLHAEADAHASEARARFIRERNALE